MSYTFSQALVAAFSRAICSETDASAPLSSTATPQAFSCDARTTARFNHSPSGMTCALLTADRGEALLTWYREGFRAPISALPARAPASTASKAGCGARWPAWFAKWNPATSEWRTAQRSLLAGSESFSETWPRSGLLLDGMCYPQPTAARGNFASASGSLLPTLTVSGNTNAKGASAKSGDGLATVLRRGVMLPTLTTIDVRARWNLSDSPNATPRPMLGAMARHGLFPALIAGDAKRGRTVYLGGNPTLALAVARMPTLTARDHKSERRSAEGFAKRAAERRGHTLPATLDQEMNGEGGPLNPDWCEWFMAHPIGWTRMQPLDPQELVRWKAEVAGGDWFEWPSLPPMLDRKVPNRVDRIRCLGNAQVPVCAATAWSVLRPCGG